MDKPSIFSSDVEAYAALNNPKDPEGQKLAFAYLREQDVAIGRVGEPRETYMNFTDYPDDAEGVRVYMEKYYDAPLEDSLPEEERWKPSQEQLDADKARRMKMN